MNVPIFPIKYRRITLFVFLSAILISISCDSDDNNNDIPAGIEGQWILVEILADPGDGSGRFMPVVSDRSITFEEDGMYSANADICSFATTDGNFTSGTYTETDNGYTIDCESQFTATLNLTLDNGELIIAYFCFEPCLQKFRRVE